MPLFQRDLSPAQAVVPAGVDLLRGVAERTVLTLIAVEAGATVTGEEPVGKSRGPWSVLTVAEDEGVFQPEYDLKFN